MAFHALEVGCCFRKYPGAPPQQCSLSIMGGHVYQNKELGKRDLPWASIAKNALEVPEGGTCVWASSSRNFLFLCVQRTLCPLPSCKQDTSHTNTTTSGTGSGNHVPSESKAAGSPHPGSWPGSLGLSFAQGWGWRHRGCTRGGARGRCPLTGCGELSVSCRLSR